MDGALIHALAIQDLIQLEDPNQFRPNQFLKNLISSARTPKVRNKLLVLHQVMVGTPITFFPNFKKGKKLSFWFWSQWWLTISCWSLSWATIPKFLGCNGDLSVVLYSLSSKTFFRALFGCFIWWPNQYQYVLSTSFFLTDDQLGLLLVPYSELFVAVLGFLESGFLPSKMQKLWWHLGRSSHLWHWNSINCHLTFRPQL